MCFSYTRTRNKTSPLCPFLLPPQTSPPPPLLSLYIDPSIEEIEIEIKGEIVFYNGIASPVRFFSPVFFSTRNWSIFQGFVSPLFFPAIFGVFGFVCRGDWDRKCRFWGFPLKRSGIAICDLGICRNPFFDPWQMLVVWCCWCLLC